MRYLLSAPNVFSMREIKETSDKLKKKII